MIKIGIVTGTRADFGLLARTIYLLQNSPEFETVVFACGTHLSPEYGMTISELKNRKVKNIVSIETLLSTQSRSGIAKSVGLATISFADVFERENLDCLLVLGDRYEILAAAQTALFLNIPIAHIHGGEITEGAFDDAIRHSITKMANIHFPATTEFANRILQLGESPHSIYVVGAPGIDNIVNEPRLSKDALEKSLGFRLSSPLALVTYHPVTKTNSNENDISPLIEAIKENTNIHYIITYPNADGEGKSIISQWETLLGYPNVQIVASLGFSRYLSIMCLVDIVIGNSSSGIIEAPSFQIPTINIGTRQKGRPRSTSVIDVPMSKAKICEAITYCQKAPFKDSLINCKNPYGEGDAARKIVDTLTSVDLKKMHIKTFTDWNFHDQT